MPKISSIFIFFFLFISCNNSDKTNKSEDKAYQKKDSTSSSVINNADNFKYDLKVPNHKWKLPEQLIEVSGNTWIDADHLILIEDLHPNLYFVKIYDKNATLEKTIPFAETEKDKVDIEDVVYTNNTVYALMEPWSII